MIRSVFAAVGVICLIAASAAAQTGNNYWLALPSANVAKPPKPPPAPEIPNVPFAPARNVHVAANFAIEKDFKPVGPWAPLWLGPDAVALLGTRKEHITLIAWNGDHFQNS